MFTSIDHGEFRALRVTLVAAQFAELLGDEAKDTLTPEQLFPTAVDHALEHRRHARVEKLIRQARLTIPHASVAEIDYRNGRGITAVRMRRYAAHDWRVDPTKLLIVSPSGGGRPIWPARSGSAPATTSTPSPTPGWTASPADWSSPAATASPTSNCSTNYRT